MAENKTKETGSSVKHFIEALPDEQKRADAFAIMEMMAHATKLEAKMWGASIVGFGSIHYKYESGREGDICLMGFSPRKQKFALYLPGGHTAYTTELKQLGKFETAKGCLYIKQIAEIDSTVLKNIFKKGAKSAAKFKK